MKERYLWIGIILVALSTAANYLYFESKQLKEPIFLDHYIAAEFNAETEPHEVYLQFYYLVNKTDPSILNYIEVDGIPLYVQNEGFTTWFNNQPQINYHQEFTHYYLMKSTVSVFSDQIPIDGKGSWTFDQIGAQFSNGTFVEADIGEIILSPLEKEGFREMETRSSSGNSNHLEENHVVVNTPLVIENFQMPFSIVEDDVAIKVNLKRERMDELESLQTAPSQDINWLEGDAKEEWDELSGVALEEELFPLEMENGDWIRVYHQYNPNLTSYHEMYIDINGVTGDGVPFTHKIYSVYQPYFNQQNIERIIAEKGRVNENE